jgi:hypothetical protein
MAQLSGMQRSRMNNAPISYELDGRQYILMVGGSSLYAWILPLPPAAQRP